MLLPENGPCVGPPPVLPADTVFFSPIVDDLYVLPRPSEEPLAEDATRPAFEADWIGEFITPAKKAVPMSSDSAADEGEDDPFSLDPLPDVSACLEDLSFDEMGIAPFGVQGEMGVAILVFNIPKTYPP